MNSTSSRRKFLKLCGLTTIPIAASELALNRGLASHPVAERSKTPVNFATDGLQYSPQEYLDRLAAIDQTNRITTDFYGRGGVVQELENVFAKQTGKESAILMPTGTMANQLALKLLNNNQTKVVVPENSHVFRDEADAAQSVHNLRLVPAGKGAPYFDLTNLQRTLRYLESGEVFRSGLGTVLIECPVRRSDGVTVPIEEIQRISEFCRTKKIKLHLDGARLHIASSYSGVGVSDYAACFDTVYVSLYKYLNASSGAVLCGDSKLIERVRHHIKIHGGTTFQNWQTSAMALASLNGLEERWAKVIQVEAKIVAALNLINGVTVSKIKNGSNISQMKLPPTIDAKRLATELHDKHSIGIRRADRQNVLPLVMNESILRRPVDSLISALKTSLKNSAIS